MSIEKYLLKKAKALDKTIVFPEASFSERIVKAGKIIAKKRLAKVVFIGDESAMILRYKKLKDITIINPKFSNLTEKFAEVLYELRKSKGLTKDQAKNLILDPFYFSTMMVHLGYADGMVGGAEVSTKTNLKPSLQIIKGKNNQKVCSGFLFYGKSKLLQNQPFVLGDAGLCEFPSEEELCQIGLNLCDFAKNLQIEPRVAFLSYSTNGSASSDAVEKVRNAANLFKNKSAYFCEGEVQLDAALVPSVAKTKLKNSYLSNKPANILVMPDINAGNITYKAIQRFSKLNAIGPIVMGLNKPVNDLSRGCNVKDIIMLTAITVLQCENKGEEKWKF